MRITSDEILFLFIRCGLSFQMRLIEINISIKNTKIKPPHRQNWTMDVSSGVAPVFVGNAWGGWGGWGGHQRGGHKLARGGWG